VTDGPVGLLVVDNPGACRRTASWVGCVAWPAPAASGMPGTLDPMATGVLVLGVGRGTRLLTYLVGADKEYVGHDPPGRVDDHRRRRGRRRVDVGREPPRRTRGQGRDGGAAWHHRPGSQRRLGDQGRREAGVRPGARRRGRRTAGPAGHCHRVRPARRSHRGAVRRRRRARGVLVGHLRPRPGPRPGCGSRASAATSRRCAAPASVRSRCRRRTGWTTWPPLDDAARAARGGRGELLAGAHPDRRRGCRRTARVAPAPTGTSVRGRAATTPRARSSPWPRTSARGPAFERSSSGERLMAVQVWHSLDVARAAARPSGSVVSIGTFDGVHRGHRVVVGQGRSRGGRARAAADRPHVRPAPHGRGASRPPTSRDRHASPPGGAAGASGRRRRARAAVRRRRRRDDGGGVRPVGARRQPACGRGRGGRGLPLRQPRGRRRRSAATMGAVRLRRGRRGSGGPRRHPVVVDRGARPRGGRRHARGVGGAGPSVRGRGSGRGGGQPRA
jgi:hypothetical protein